jgi:hypothetical protein
MATTTNYGWTTPDDTALVKDGASAIRTLGSSVDTTTKALNPSTTLGDIEYRSSTANTNTRLGIGSSGQVLAVSAGVPAWTTVSSGGMTLISTTTLSGATTTVSSIPSGYNNLQVIIRNAKPATDGTSLRVRVNGDSGTNYLHQTGNFSPNEAFSETGWSIHQELDNTVVTGNICFINLYDYTGSHWKTGNSFGANNDYTTTANSTLIVRNLIYNGTGAITSLVFYAGSGNLTSGDVLLYGVK